MNNKSFISNFDPISSKKFLIIFQIVKFKYLQVTSNYLFISKKRIYADLKNPGKFTKKLKKIIKINKLSTK